MVVNLIFTLCEDHKGIHQNSFKGCLHIIKEVQEACSKRIEHETISNASSSADENCLKLVTTYIQSDL